LVKGRENPRELKIEYDYVKTIGLLIRNLMINIASLSMRRIKWIEVSKD